MEALQPLAVLQVGFAARQMPYIPGIDQKRFHPALFNLLKQRDPVNAGRFHNHRGHTAALEPLDQLVQLMREGSKLPDSALLGSDRMCPHTDEVGAAADINSGSIRI